MPGEGVPHQHLSGRTRVQQTLIGGLKETLVGIEARLEQLVEEFSEDAAAIDACLIQSVGIQQVDPDALFQVWFCRKDKWKPKGQNKMVSA